jgi:hypothetical protein
LVGDIGLNGGEVEGNPFDFEKHERDAVVAYLEKQSYSLLSGCLRTNQPEISDITTVRLNCNELVKSD